MMQPMTTEQISAKLRELTERRRQYGPHPHVGYRMMLLVEAWELCSAQVRCAPRGSSRELVLRRMAQTCRAHIDRLEC